MSFGVGRFSGRFAACCSASWPAQALRLMSKGRNLCFRVNLLSFFIVESPVAGGSSAEAFHCMGNGACLNVGARLWLLEQLVGAQLRPFDRRKDSDSSECGILHVLE